MSEMPNSLNQLNTAFPLDGASYYELAEEVRALKAVFKAVLLVSHTPFGAIREVSAGTVAANAIGSDNIQDGALLERHFGNQQIPTAAIQLLAITAALLADGAVTEAKYGAASIPSGAFKVGSIPLNALVSAIGAANLSSSPTTDGLRAVGQDHLKNGAVTNRAVSDVSFEKLSGGDEGAILVKGASAWTAATLSGGALNYNTGTGQFDLTTPHAYAAFGDSKARGQNGGSATANTWITRDLGELSDENDLMTFVGNVFTLPEGEYFFYASVPGHGVGRHQARLFRDNGDSTNEIPLWGTSEVAPSGNQSRSVIQGRLVVTDEAHTFKIQHWCQSTTDAKDFGEGSSSDNAVVYGNHMELFTTGYIIRLVDNSTP